MKLSLKVPVVLALLLVVARVNGEEENIGAVEKIRFGLNHNGKNTTLLGEETFPLFFACGTNGNGDHKATGLNTIFYELYADTAPESGGRSYAELYEMWTRDLSKIAQEGYQVIIYIHNTNHDRDKRGFFPFDEEWRLRVTKMVETFKSLPNLAGWAFSDECGDHVGYPVTEFREFLKKRYSDITKLNVAWESKYNAFDEIALPYLDKDGSSGTGIPTQDILNHKYPLGVSRRAFDAADFKLFRVRNAHKIFEDLVRKVDPITPLWSGAHNLAWAATQVPPGWGAWHDAYPTYSGDDWLTHHAWFQGILRGQNFRPVLPMLMVETSNSSLAAKWNLDPGTWGGWMTQAALLGSSGAAFWPWSLLAEARAPEEKASAEERRRFLGTTIKQISQSDLFEMLPQNTVAVLYEPYAEGWAGVSQVYGLLPKPTRTPLGLFQNFAFGTFVGGVDYLTVDTALAADLESYGVILAPFAADIPPALQTKLDQFVKKGGILVADIGFSSKNADGNVVSMTPSARELFGISSLTASRIERKWTLANPVPAPFSKASFVADFDFSIKGLVGVSATTAQPVFQGSDGQGLFVNRVGDGLAFFYSGIMFDPETMSNPNIKTFLREVLSNRARILRVADNQAAVSPKEIYSKSVQMLKFSDGFAIANLTDESVNATLLVDGVQYSKLLEPRAAYLNRNGEFRCISSAFFPAPALSQ